MRGSRLGTSYAPSTGSKDRESLGQNVLGGVVVALMGSSAIGTNLFPHGQIKVRKDMFADRTRFAGWVPPVDFDQGAPIPTGFVIQLAHELTPPYIADGTGKMRHLSWRRVEPVPVGPLHAFA